MSAALVLWRISHNKNLLLAWSFVLDCGVVGSAALADAKWQKLKDKFKLFLKMGPNQNLSFYFCSFQIHFYRKKYGLQQDSNSDHQSRRHARWPLAHHHGPNTIKLFGLFKLWQTSHYIFLSNFGEIRSLFWLHSKEATALTIPSNLVMSLREINLTIKTHFKYKDTNLIL